jgi:hypothetical protein
MGKLATLCLAVAVCALVGTGAAAGDDDSSKRWQRPDSIVTCQGSAGGYRPINVTTPSAVKLDECAFDEPVCSDCVRSLEKQGCKVLDVVISNFPPASGGGAGIPNTLPEFPVVITDPRTSFVLSCERP